MKKCYLTPAVTIVKMQSMSIICGSDNVDSVSSNVGLQGAGANGSIIGTNTYARTKESSNVWDEEW